MKRLALLLVLAVVAALVIGRWRVEDSPPALPTSAQVDCSRFLFKARGDPRGMVVVPPECAHLFFEGVEPPQARGRTPGAQPGFQAAGLFGPCSVLRVIDGDTIDVGCGGQRDRVRLLRIDTPSGAIPDTVLLVKR